MKRYWLFPVLAIIALIVVIVMPFTPVIFWPIAVFVVVGITWAIYEIIRLKKAEKAHQP